MSTTMKTPGVYIQELDAFGNAVVPVPTAVPAFIGYTAQTSFNGKNLVKKAVKITSLADFLSVYGNEPPQVKFDVSMDLDPAKFITLLTAFSEASNAFGTATNDVAVKTTAKQEADTAVEEAEEDKKSGLQPAADTAQTDLDTANKTLTTANETKVKTLALVNRTMTLNDNFKAWFDALKPLQTTLVGALSANPQVKATITAAQTPVTTALAPDDLATVKTTYNETATKADFSFGGYAYTLTRSTVNYRMYGSMKFFYENGGGECYVMSIGGYDPTEKNLSDTTDFLAAIKLLEKEMEPTMLVIPDLIEITPTPNAYSLQGEMINHCATMMNRVALLDIPGGFSEPPTGETSVDTFRNNVSGTLAKNNSYAAAYYPWLHTTVYQSSNISYLNFTNNNATYGDISSMLTEEFTDKDGKLDDEYKKVISAFSKDLQNNPPQTPLEQADAALNNLSKSYQLIKAKILSKLNLMAPSAAMAGIYTMVDNNIGVWQAPANVVMQSVEKPAIKIDNQTQEDLNKPLSGKSVCAIRAFKGEGNLVWGARTLDGNSNDWRYINVRRTLIFIEQSVKEAAKAYVFAPNDASTWVNVQSMISNFLIGVWKQGGLVGPKPADAFSVSVGLGVTMSNDDIQNGIMRVSVKVAVSHPAEFIEITFQQQQQKP